MDLICYSHLRWNFVYQRPQHLLSRFAKQFRTFYIEEPIFDADKPFLDTSLSNNVWIVIPHLVANHGNSDNITQQRKLLSDLFSRFNIHKRIDWYYTPMALEITKELENPDLIVYDCMDELSAFKNAPADMKTKEAELMNRADIVFTGGQTLYESKKHLHKNIYPFPSSIDKAHFGKARMAGADPADQASISHPRVGFYGVIDERLDIDLLEELAVKKPEWQLILIGPIVKIDRGTLPRLANIRFLGPKNYTELPDYLRGWDVAMLPFAINASTKFISPTKTPEYLAGGKPVISTAITDVINPYGKNGLVFIGNTSSEFVAGIEWALGIKNDLAWLNKVDAYLEGISWDKTWDKMIFYLNSIIEKKQLDNKKGECVCLTI
jgi:glycosyltransferase involved in cell wall biosynthesis